MKRYMAAMLAVFLFLSCGVVAEAEGEEFFSSENFNTLQHVSMLPPPFLIQGGGTSELCLTDRGSSLCFSVGNKNLSYIKVNLRSIQSSLTKGFQLGFSTKDIGQSGWGHRFFLLSGYTNSGQKKDIYLGTFSKVNHRLTIGTTDTGLYRQNLWYDFVMRFVINDTQKYVDIAVTAPLASDFAASARVDLSDLVQFTGLGLYSGVTSDPSSSVTLYDDIYIAATEKPLCMTACVPQNGSDAVSNSTVPNISFNHPLRPETVSNEQVKLYCNDVLTENANVCLSQDKQTILLHLPRGSALSPNSQYRVLLSGVTDIFGSILAPTEIYFTTGQGIGMSDLVFFKKGQTERLRCLESGVITAQTTLVGAQNHVFLYLALYQKADGRLVDSDLTAADENGFLLAQLTVPEDYENYSLYAYLWNMESGGQKPIVRAARLY